VHRDLPALVRLLVDAGADASVSNRYGVRPIALAATNGSAEDPWMADRRAGTPEPPSGGAKA